MKKTNLDIGWRFSLDGATETIVNLPHDFSIDRTRMPNSRMGSSGGFFQGGNGVYKKSITLSQDLMVSKVILEIEGAYMNAEVSVNGNLVAFNPYGYTTFHADLSPWLDFEGYNELEVRVGNDALPNSRWYSGSGLYRHVWLLTGQECTIAPWGIFITTPIAEANSSTIRIETLLSGEGLLRHTLLDAFGTAVVSSEARVTPGKDSQELIVLNANLWDSETPYMYKAVTELIVGGKLFDKVETPFGIRSIALDKKKGFLLNGKPLKLKGGCVHHDCGLLGAAAYDRAEERKVILHKNAGYNAVRCAHNPPSPTFLDACDRYGILVIDEAFDCWRMGKNACDYHLYFEDWWQKDLAAMILRDRNHPSIAFWSTGNEISERFGKSDGPTWAADLAAAARELDSTRFITNALCGSWLKWFPELENQSEPFASVLDVVGYNYMWQYYGEILERHPDRYILGTETIAGDAFESWTLTEEHPRVLGDFVWTSLDYLGESGIGHSYMPHEQKRESCLEYPWHLANCGDFDVCYRPKPQSYYRQILWGQRTAPWIVVHLPNSEAIKSTFSYWGWWAVQHSWSWPGYEGCRVNVDVYSQCDEVELFLNGRSAGRNPAGKAKRNIASFTVVYEPGLILAVAYQDGQVTGRDSITTCAKPSAIHLDADRLELKASYGDLAYITATVTDETGSIVPYANTELFFEVIGAGELAAVGTSDPMSEESYVGNRRKAFEGSALIVVRSIGTAGDIVVTASADGLEAVSIQVLVK